MQNYWVNVDFIAVLVLHIRKETARDAQKSIQREIVFLVIVLTKRDWLFAENAVAFLVMI